MDIICPPSFNDVFAHDFVEGRSKQLGPLLKLVICIVVIVFLVLWPVVGIFGSIVAGAGYGFFAPVLATFEAVGEGKTDEFIHCFVVLFYDQIYWLGLWILFKMQNATKKDILNFMFLCIDRMEHGVQSKEVLRWSGT